jgi:hypothetical protein
MICSSEKLELTVLEFDIVFKIKKYGKVKIKPTLGDAEIRWPAVILTIPETAYVEQSSRVLKVRPVNGKLVVCI